MRPPKGESSRGSRSPSRLFLGRAHPPNKRATPSWFAIARVTNITPRMRNNGNGTWLRRRLYGCRRPQPLHSFKPSRCGAQRHFGQGSHGRTRVVGRVSPTYRLLLIGFVPQHRGVAAGSLERQQLPRRNQQCIRWHRCFPGFGWRTESRSSCCQTSSGRGLRCSNSCANEQVAMDQGSMLDTFRSDRRAGRTSKQGAPIRVGRTNGWHRSRKLVLARRPARVVALAGGRLGGLGGHGIVRALCLCPVPFEPIVNGSAAAIIAAADAKNRLYVRQLQATVGRIEARGHRGAGERKRRKRVIPSRGGLGQG